jgi:hypothetical protein
MFDAFARRAVETMDRKRLIGVLSSVAIAVIARPSQAYAKKHRSNGKKKCFSQRVQYLDFVRNLACRPFPVSPAREGDRLIAQPVNCVTLSTGIRLAATPSLCATRPLGLPASRSGA